jgi:hypothetical protein
MVCPDGVRETRSIARFLPAIDLSPFFDFKRSLWLGLPSSLARLVIMDEPTAALRVRASGQVLNLIRTIRERGLPVILISYDMPHAGGHISCANLTFCPPKLMNFSLAAQLEYQGIQRQGAVNPWTASVRHDDPSRPDVFLSELRS